MTLEEKLEVSETVSIKNIPLKKMGIMTSKQRKRSLILFLLMLAFTIYTKFILKSLSFDMLTVFIIINLLSLFALKIMAKSTIALNHNQIYKFVVFLNKLCKVGIFAFSLLGYYQHFKVYIPEHYNIQSQQDLPEVLLDLLWNDFKFISFGFTLILFIPTFIYFAIFIIKYYILSIAICHLFLAFIFIPGLNVLIILKFIFQKKNRFRYYHMSDDGTYVVVENREIHSYAHRLSTIFVRFLIALPIIIVIGVAYYYIYQRIKMNLN